MQRGEAAASGLLSKNPGKQGSHFPLVHTLYYVCIRHMWELSHLSYQNIFKSSVVALASFVQWLECQPSGLWLDSGLWPIFQLDYLFSYCWVLRVLCLF